MRVVEAVLSALFLGSPLVQNVLAFTETLPKKRIYQERWRSTSVFVMGQASFSSNPRALSLIYCSTGRNTNCRHGAIHGQAISTKARFRKMSAPVSATARGAAAAATTSSMDDGQRETIVPSEDDKDVQPQQSQQLSVAAASLNLIKAIIGSGVLALPSGVAAMSDFPQALIPASILLLVLGSLSAYTFGLYGRICHVHQAKTLGEAWEKEFQTSPWLLSLALFLFCGGAALTYNIVMGDTFSCLAASLGMTGWLASRHASILFISITTLLPLCSLQSLAALAPMSMLGVIGVLVTTLFMGWRCLSPASPYRLAPSAAAAMAAVGAISQKQQQQQRLVRVAPTAASAFLSSLSPEFYPKFKTYSKIISPSALILTAMAATAFSGHFSAPDFYHSLKDGSNDDDDKFALRKYHRVTAISFFSVAVINICILAFGFLTFGGSSAGIILNNYSTLDKGASLCRFLMALCVIGGYPFLISACKNALLEVGDHFNKKKKKKINDKHEIETSSHRRRRLEAKVARTLVATFTALALILPNAGFVISFNGALLGSIFCYILPAILFLSNTAKSSASGRAAKSGQLRLERGISYGLVALGSVVGLAGGTVSILNAYFPQVLR